MVSTPVFAKFAYSVLNETELQADVVGPAGYDSWPAKEQISTKAAIRHAWTVAKTKMANVEKSMSAGASSDY